MIAAGQQHLHDEVEATEPSETRQERTQGFQNYLASIPASSELVTGLSSFPNINNFIAIHPACGNQHGEDSSRRTDSDVDHDNDTDRSGGGDGYVNSDPNYGFSDLHSQGHGSYNSGPSGDIRLNDNLDLSQTNVGDSEMGCMDGGRGCTSAEVYTSGRYNHGLSRLSLPEGAEYCMTDESQEQTALKTIAPVRLAEEHEEAQQHPDANCGEYFPLQTNSSGYITEAISAANLRGEGSARNERVGESDQRNRFLPILEVFFETNRKEKEQTTGQQVNEVEGNPSAVAPADESPSPSCSHTPASALAVVVASGRNRDEEEDEDNDDDGDEIAASDDEMTVDEVTVSNEQLGADEVDVSDEQLGEDSTDYEMYFI